MKWILYWFLVGYGLNHGLIPQENAAMTALAINQTVVDDTGRTDLCVDYAAGNYTPNTRGFELLNEAQQFLDRMYRNRGEEDCLTIDVEAGDYQIDVPNIRHVTRMDMTAADGTRHELRRRSYAFMREQYGESFSLLDTGKPVDWARSIGEWLVEAAVLLDNGDFEDGSSDWTVGFTPITFASGKAIFNSVSGSYIEQSFTALSDVSDFSFDLDIAAIGNGSPSPSEPKFVVTFYNAASTLLQTLTYTSIGAKHEDLSLLGVTRMRITSPNATSTEHSLNSVQLSVEGIKADYIFLPPADQPYTLCVFGGYYTRKFEIATDMSWWSDTYPGLLVMAYKMMIERHMHANDTRVNFWSGQIAFETKKLQIDLNEEDTAGPPKYMRRMPSAMWKRHQ